MQRGLLRWTAQWVSAIARISFQKKGMNLKIGPYFYKALTGSKQYFVLAKRSYLERKFANAAEEFSCLKLLVANRMILFESSLNRHIIMNPVF